jgi:hypothetical protein
MSDSLLEQEATEATEKRLLFLAAVTSFLLQAICSLCYLLFNILLL